MTNQLELYQRKNQRHPNLDLARDIVAPHRLNKAREATQEKVIHPVTGNRLTVDDGIVFEGGKRQMSTRAMLAAVLAKGKDR